MTRALDRIAQQRPVFVSVGTTDLRGDVIQISAVQNEQLLLNVFLNTTQPIHPDALRLHGVTHEYLAAHGVDPETALTELLLALGDQPAAAYNTAFVLAALNRTLGRPLPELKPDTWLDVQVAASVDYVPSAISTLSLLGALRLAGLPQDAAYESGTPPGNALRTERLCMRTGT